jgi:hypothetical protein
MPSRLTTTAIIAFWLATTYWYVSRDLWPRLTAPAPPPYVIDLADEALRQAVPIRWSLWRNGKKVTPIRTSVKYDKFDDSFEMSASMSSVVEFELFGQTIKIKKVEDNYRVNRAGQLLGFATTIGGSIQSYSFELQIDATVTKGEAQIRCRLESPAGVLEPKVPPYPITQAGVFNPLHPVNRIQGVRPGMKWTLPLVDPVSDARWFALQALVPSELGQPLSQLTSSTTVKMLRAEVVGPKVLASSPPTNPVECNVIEYQGDGYSAKTWLRVSDGAVMRQEATVSGEELVLERE